MKKLYTLSLCFCALLALVACGENWYGSGSEGGSDVKSLRIDAENAFRKGDYQKSYNICKKITEINPSSSFGYYGMAKAGLWQHRVSPLGIFSLVKPDDGECPFMVDTMKVRNNYLQAMRKIFDALTELDRRDSLTALWEFHKRAKDPENKEWARDTIFTIIITNADGKEEKRDVNLDQRLADFRRVFCGGNSSNNCSDTTSGKKNPFPISDREYTSSYFGGILLLSSFSKVFLNFFDTNGDGCLTKKDRPGIDFPSTASEWKEWGCAGKDNYDLSISVRCPRDPITGEMNVVIDNKKILEDLEDELKKYYEDAANCTKDCEKQEIPPQIKDLNDKIDNFGDAFGDVLDILDGMGLGGSGDPDIDQGSLKDEIEKYKAYASFYKMGAHYDVDGDGCIDEELLDGQDNDGDGFVNENSRLSSTDPNDKLLYGVNSMNNCMVGNNRYKDDSNWEYNKPVNFQKSVPICNVPNCSKSPCNLPSCTLLPVNEEGWVTVLNFTQKGYPDGKGYWTTNDANLKLEVAQDTTCSKYNLEYRKQKIGGCWPFYDETKFRRYYCK